MHNSRSEPALLPHGRGAAVRLTPVKQRPTDRTEEKQQTPAGITSPTRLVDGSGRPLASLLDPQSSTPSPSKLAKMDSDGLPELSFLSPQHVKATDGDMSAILVGKVKKMGVSNLSVLSAAKNSPLVLQQRQTKLQKAQDESYRAAQLMRSGVSRHAAYQPVGANGKATLVSDGRVAELEAPSSSSLFPGSTHASSQPQQKLRVTDFSGDGGMGGRFVTTLSMDQPMERPTSTADGSNPNWNGSSEGPSHLRSLAHGVAEKSASLRAQLRGLDLLSTAFGQLIEEIGGSKGNLARLLRRVRDNYRLLFSNLINDIMALNEEYHTSLKGCVTDFKTLQMKMDGKVAHLEQRVRLLTSVSTSKDQMLALSESSIKALEHELHDIKESVMLGVKTATVTVERATNALVDAARPQGAAERYGMVHGTANPSSSPNPAGVTTSEDLSGFSSNGNNAEALQALSQETRALSYELSELIQNVEYQQEKSANALGSLDHLLDRSVADINELGEDAALNVAMSSGIRSPKFSAGKPHRVEQVALMVEPSTPSHGPSPIASPIATPSARLTVTTSTETADLIQPSSGSLNRPARLSVTSLPGSTSTSSGFHPLVVAERPSSAELRKSSRWQYLRHCTDHTKPDSKWTSATQTDEAITNYITVLHLESVNQVDLWKKAQAEVQQKLHSVSSIPTKASEAVRDEEEAKLDAMRQNIIQAAEAAKPGSNRRSLVGEILPVGITVAQASDARDSGVATGSHARTGSAAAIATSNVGNSAAQVEGPAEPQQLRPFPLRINGFILPANLREFLSPLFASMNAKGVLTEDNWSDELNLAQRLEAAGLPQSEASSPVVSKGRKPRVSQINTQLRSPVPSPSPNSGNLLPTSASAQKGHQRSQTHHAPSTSVSPAPSRPISPRSAVAGGSVSSNQSKSNYASRRGSINGGVLPLAQSPNLNQQQVTIVARDSNAHRSDDSSATPVSPSYFEPMLLGKGKRSSMNSPDGAHRSVVEFKEPLSASEMNPGVFADESRFALSAPRETTHELTLPSSQMAECMPPMDAKDIFAAIFRLYASYVNMTQFNTAASSPLAVASTIQMPTLTFALASTAAIIHPSANANLPPPPPNGLAELLIDWCLEKSGSISKAPLFLGSFLATLMSLYQRNEFIRHFCHFIGIVQANISGIDASDFTAVEGLDMYARSVLFFLNAKSVRADPTLHAPFEYNGEASVGPPLSYVATRTCDLFASEVLTSLTIKLPHLHDFMVRIQTWTQTSMRQPNPKLPENRAVNHLSLPGFLLRVSREWRAHIRGVIVLAAKKATPPLELQSNNNEIDLEQWMSFLRHINATATEALSVSKAHSMLRQFAMFNRRMTNPTLDLVFAGLVPLLRTAGFLSINVHHLLA